LLRRWNKNPQPPHGPTRRRHILKFTLHLASVQLSAFSSTLAEPHVSRIHISSPIHDHRHLPPTTPSQRPQRAQTSKMTTAAATLSIQKDPSYAALKSCAQTCVDKNSSNKDLEGHLKCGDLKILDSCFCGADNRPEASAFLSSCIVTRCKYTAAEVTSVYQVYDGYCGFKPTKAATVSATTTKKSSSTSRSKLLWGQGRGFGGRG
jgi:hypothetical protein